MGLDTSGWNIDHQQNPALYKIADTLQEDAKYKQQMEYRNQKDKEADEFRKLAMIRDFADPDKYHTGEETADAILDKKLTDLLEEFTLASKTMSLTELQATLPKRVQKMGTAALAMKGELAQSDKEISAINQLYPGLLNTQGMRTAHRAEIVKRRLDGKSDFRNPLDIGQSEFDFNNPEVLADFMPQDSDKIVLQELSDPKLYTSGSGAMGNRDSYSKFSSKLSPFAISNLTPESYNEDLFVKKGFKPGFKFDSKQDDLFGTKVETLSPEAYKAGFTQKANLAFTAMAKRGMPQWSKMTPEEKDKSIRAVALDYVKRLDKSEFSFENANPPAARTTNNNYIGGADGLQLNKIQERLINNISEDLDKGYNVTRWNKLKADEGGLISKYATENGVTINPKQDVVRLNSNDEVEVYSVPTKADGSSDWDRVIQPENLKLTLPKGAFADIRNQTNVKAKNQRTADANTQSNKKPTGKIEDLRKKYNY